MYLFSFVFVTCWWLAAVEVVEVVGVVEQVVGVEVEVVRVEWWPTTWMSTSTWESVGLDETGGGGGFSEGGAAFCTTAPKSTQSSHTIAFTPPTNQSHPSPIGNNKNEWNKTNNGIGTQEARRKYIQPETRWIGSGGLDQVCVCVFVWKSIMGDGLCVCEKEGKKNG